MKWIVLILLLLVSCKEQSTAPVVEQTTKISYTVEKWKFVFDDSPYYAYDGDVESVGTKDIDPIFPKITFQISNRHPVEYAYGLLGDRQGQFFNGPINPTTKLRVGEKKFFLVRTRVLTNLPTGEEPLFMFFSFEYDSIAAQNWFAGNPWANVHKEGI